ncbi:MAG: hypothetical protein RLZZ263_482, partial [Cyanobacteriota bacterium]
AGGGWALGLEGLEIVLGLVALGWVVAGHVFFVVCGGYGAEPLALQLARQLRLTGRRVELDLSASAFGKQFKRADRAGARWALVLGDSEAEAGVVTLKNLRGGPEAVEERLSLEELLKRFA